MRKQHIQKNNILGKIKYWGKTCFGRQHVKKHIGKKQHILGKHVEKKNHVGKKVRYDKQHIV